MALGEYSYGNTDNNKRKMRVPEIYSQYNTSNENSIDPSALSYSFWNGSLKISIAPILKNPTEKQKWDYKNASTVFLTHRYAYILYQGILKVLKGEVSSAGTKSGAEGLIIFSDGKEVGADNYCLIIRKIDQNTGQINSTYIYEFRKGYHYGIDNFDSTTSNFDKVFYDDIELKELLHILEDYSRAASKAYASFVVDELKYNDNRINTKLGLMAEKLGVEFKGSNDYNGGGGSSYFDKESSSSSTSYSQRNNSSRQISMDDIERSGSLIDDEY